MRSPILGRVAMLVVMLVLPLSLAFASQALASRPGAPAIEDVPVRLPGVTGSDAPRTDPRPPRPSSSPTTDGPRIVQPEVPPAGAEDDDEDDEGDD